MKKAAACNIHNYIKMCNEATGSFSDLSDESSGAMLERVGITKVRGGLRVQPLMPPWQAAGDDNHGSP